MFMNDVKKSLSREVWENFTLKKQITDVGKYE